MIKYGYRKYLLSNCPISNGTGVRFHRLMHNTTQKAYDHKAEYVEDLKILTSWWSSFLIKISNRDL